MFGRLSAGQTGRQDVNGNKNVYWGTRIGRKLRTADIVTTRPSSAADDAGGYFPDNHLSSASTLRPTKLTTFSPASSDGNDRRLSSASTVLQRNLDTTTTSIDMSLYLEMLSISVLSIISGGSSNDHNTEIVGDDNDNCIDGSEAKADSRTYNFDEFNRNRKTGLWTVFKNVYSRPNTVNSTVSPIPSPPPAALPPANHTLTGAMHSDQDPFRIRCCLPTKSSGK